jgi:hypothetical protein
MVCGDIGSWSRKHTGTADTETQETIDEQVANAHMYYDQLCADKTAMESITMNKRKQAQMLGILFAEYQILTTEQASIIRDQMKRPSHVYSDSNSLWAFYNYVTIALQQSHPKTWMEDQRILHMFISEVNRFAPVSTPVQVLSTPPQDLSTPVPEVDPNQINLLDAIAEAELADNQVVQEEVEIESVVHQSEEIIEETIEAEEVPLELDEIVQYTDPAGNTFEAPIVIDDFAEEDNFDLDFTETEEETGDVPDFF